jgi:FecR protein
MHWYRRSIFALLSIVVAALQSSASNAETRIGVASSTRPNAEGVHGTNSEVLSAGSEVYANEKVRTGNLGRADLVLLDNTNFSVGPASEVLLDKFVYDPTGSSGKVVVQATRGAFRFVTGSQDHRAYQVGTPWGTLGVRGTVVEGKVLPAVSKGTLPADECVVKLNLQSGQASFTTLTGNVYPLVAGQTLCIMPNGQGRYLPLESVFETAAVTQPSIGGVPIVGTPPITTSCISQSTRFCP